jgi:two-component system chemotaxis response regulator CheY
VSRRWKKRVAIILVVDDEPDVRFLIRLIFESAGHKVTEAANGAAAMECMLEHLPDLVVTDMMMPVMNGAELMARLRADPVMSGIPVLAVSGNPDQADEADATLAKPFEPKELVAVAASLLKARV